MHFKLACAAKALALQALLHPSVARTEIQQQEGPKDTGSHSMSQHVAAMSQRVQAGDKLLLELYVLMVQAQGRSARLLAPRNGRSSASTMN